MSTEWLEDDAPATDHVEHPVLHALLAMAAFAAISGIATALILMLLIRVALS